MAGAVSSAATLADARFVIAPCIFARNAGTSSAGARVLGFPSQAIVNSVASSRRLVSEVSSAILTSFSFGAKIGLIEIFAASIYLLLLGWVSQFLLILEKSAASRWS